MTVSFCIAYLNLEIYIHQSGVLTALFDCYMADQVLTSFGSHKIGSPLLCVMEVALLIDLHVDCGVAGAVRCRDRVGCR